MRRFLPGSRMAMAAWLAAGVLAASGAAAGEDWSRPEPSRPDQPPAALHLASYRAPAGAHVAWNVLSARLGPLHGLEPHFQPITLPGKGRLVRVLAVGASRAELARRCAALTAQGQYCRFMDQAAMHKP